MYKAVIRHIVLSFVQLKRMVIRAFNLASTPAAMVSGFSACLLGSFIECFAPIAYAAGPNGQPLCVHAMISRNKYGVCGIQVWISNIMSRLPGSWIRAL